MRFGRLSTRAATPNPIDCSGNVKPILRSRRAAIPSILLLLMGLLAPAGAWASGAHLDTDFGTAGVAVLPPQFGQELIGAGFLDDGGVVVANHEDALGLLPSGGIDPGFGQAGIATYAVPSGAERTYVYGFGVDAEGKLVLAGQTGHEGTDPVERTFVERLAADGVPDPTFAGDGYLVGGLPLLPREAGTPTVGLVSDVRFDSAGRIVISVSSEVGSMITKNGPSPRFEGFIARLESSGALDPSFGEGGFYRGGGGIVGVAPGNRFILGEPAAEAIFRLEEDGRLDPGFGKDGRARYPPGVADGQPEVDPYGRTVIWRFMDPVKGKRPAGVVIRRLRANGTPDLGFGDRGLVRRRIPGSRQLELGFDGQGRILLEATLAGSGETGAGKELGLIRLTQGGRIDRSFGDQGTVRIPFSGRPDVYLGRSEGKGWGVEGERALLRGVSCAQGSCRPTLSIVDLD
jgi:uncharacterized delta-60 repeat protein